MATEAAIGKRRLQAIRRIEAHCQALGGGKELKLPKNTHYGLEMLVVYQLEAVADYLETVEPPKPPSDYEALKFDDLKAMAVERGLEEEVKPLRSKATVIALLEAADAADKEKANA